MKKIISLFSFLIFIFYQNLQANDPVHVWLKIFYKRNKITIINTNGFVLNHNYNHNYFTIELALRNNRLLINNEPLPSLIITPPEHSVTKFITKYGTKQYKGEFYITVKNNHFFFINTLSLNEYLEGVIASELGDSFLLETLKAQAIVSRSYFLLQSYQNEEYDAVDLGGVFQSYLGNQQVTKKIKTAVELTSQEILWARDHPFLPFFHSTCGGTLFTPKQVWGNSTKDENFFRIIDGNNNAPNCSISPYYKWHFKIKKKKLYTLLARGLNMKTNYKIKRIQFTTETELLQKVQITINPKIAKGSIDHHPITKNLTENQFKSILEKQGFSKLYSCHVVITETLFYFIFSGKGYGHLVGLCQWGAENLARRGYSYNKILQYYFPGTTLKRLSKN